MELRFRESLILDFASRYYVDDLEVELIRLAPEIQKQGFLTKEQMKKVVRWKSKRVVHHVAENEDGYVEEVTSLVFSSMNERVKVEGLTIIGGVGWPVASVVLHLFHEDKYPILDFRALWSVGEVVPKSYEYSFWKRYVKFCREVAARNGIGMRDLDRALWQYSKENQGYKSGIKG